MIKKAKIEMSVFLSISLAVLIATHFVSILYTPMTSVGETKLFMINKGTGFATIASNLKKEGLIKDTSSINFVAKIKGAHRSIQAGEYELNTNMSPIAIINTLTSGKTKKYSITIPEGFRITEIAKRIVAKGLLREGEFEKVALNVEVAKKYGLTSPSLEGYLFPDTYLFAKGVSAEEIVRSMIKRFNNVYKELDPSESGYGGLNKEEVIILASIIEKEAGTTEEMSRISSVFRNRLKKRMRMQSCPTVIYDIKNFDGNLKIKHLRTDTPFNTYTKGGLPPGPISNPGRLAISAALNPSGETYLYFVSMNNGTHYFSKSLKEHNRAVDKFQKRLKFPFTPSPQ